MQKFQRRFPSWESSGRSVIKTIIFDEDTWALRVLRCQQSWCAAPSPPGWQLIHSMAWGTVTWGGHRRPPDREWEIQAKRKWPFPSSSPLDTDPWGLSQLLPWSPLARWLPTVMASTGAIDLKLQSTGSKQSLYKNQKFVGFVSYLI